MGNVNEGGAQFLVQLGNLGSHLGTELSVQVGQRFVQQEHFGFTNDSTAQRNTLALAAGQRLGFPVQQVGDVQNPGSFFHSLLDFRFGNLPQLQAKRHVVVHGHMGVQSIVLEHHCNVSVFGGYVVHQFSVNVQLAFRNLFQTGNHPQSSGLTAAGRTDQNDKFLVFDFQVEVADRYHVACILFVNASQR